MTRTRLALFDVDGTLVWTHGAGRRSMQRALVATVGRAGPMDHRYDGKTDRQIVREAMRHEGFTDADVNARMDAVLARYLIELSNELGTESHGAKLLPGVARLLDALEARDDVVLGLLTGNLVPGAERKLRAVGVDFARFVVGAFGSDHEQRAELPRIACARASAYLGRPVGGDACVIIGDTPNDVACARPIGARAIAVATGSYDVTALSACGAHAVFADLSDAEAVLHAILDA
ncbi:MAG TPA: haloacid dehalogenase-like hydrolase [Gemmatimonadaceae bacterium]|nr:haloacid dehalogenase-like hydrolase [Gemmatimonadaceae bacterium]